MKKVALVAVLLFAVVIGFSAPKALIGGAFGINATNPTYQPVRFAAPTLDLSLQLPFTDFIGTTLSAQAAVRALQNKIGFLNADIYFQVYESLNLKVRFLVSVGTVQDSRPCEQSWYIGSINLGAPHLSLGGGFQVMAPISEKATLNAYARALRVLNYPTRQETPEEAPWYMPEFFSVGLGLLYSF